MLKKTLVAFQTPHKNCSPGWRLCCVTWHSSLTSTTFGTLSLCVLYAVEQLLCWSHIRWSVRVKDPSSIKGFYLGMCVCVGGPLAKLGVWGQRVSYAEQIVKPIEANCCELWNWAVKNCSYLRGSSLQPCGRMANKALGNPSRPRPDRAGPTANHMWLGPAWPAAQAARKTSSASSREQYNRRTWRWRRGRVRVSKQEVGGRGWEVISGK